MEELSIVLNYIKNNKKNVLIIILVFIIFFLSSIFIVKINEKPKVKIIEKKVIKKVKEKEKNEIKVDIKGQVVNPGVYVVNKNTRINDVIKLAGGLTYKANTDYINLSKKIEDEMVIFIYSDYEISKLKEEEKIKEQMPTLTDENLIVSKSTTNKTQKEIEKEDNNITDKININTATKEQLMQLSGIGESKAESIISYRKKKKFDNILQIKEVSGIGDSIFEKIKENITV